MSSDVPFFPLLTTAEVASHLGVSRQTIWRLICRGDLRVVKVGPRGNRFRRADVEAFLKRKESKRGRKDQGQEASQ